MREVSIFRIFSSKVLLFLGLLISAVLGLMPAVLLIVRGNLIDDILKGNIHFVKMMIAFAAVTAAGIICSYFLYYIEEKQNIIDGYKKDKNRIEYCNRIAFKELESSKFHQLNNSASEVSLSLKELNKGIDLFVKNCVQVISPLAIIFDVDFKIFMGIIIFLLLNYIINHVIIKNTGDIWKEYRENIRKSNYFSGLLINREFASERKLWGFRKSIEERFNREFGYATVLNKQVGRKRLISEGITNFTRIVYSGVIVILLLQALLSRKITVGYFISVFYTSMTLLTNVNSIMSGIYDVRLNKQKVLPYYELLNMTTHEENELIKFTDDSSYTIEFCNVSFAYPGSEHKVLENISFVLKPGMHYALVGENGCGKTTIVKLMLGLYEPTEGEILLNGIPLKKYSRKFLNKVFSPVFQDYYQYPVSVRENVLMGSDKKVSDDKIITILKELSMDEVINKLKNGLNTILTPMNAESSNLSGGEWQKLAIARCIVSDAYIAILDEPNAALDPIVESTIYDAYRQMLKKKMTLFISHRLGSVRVADNIIVIKDGKVIANGSHMKLMNECGYYSKLYNTQKELYNEK